MQKIYLVLLVGILGTFIGEQVQGMSAKIDNVLLENVEALANDTEKSVGECPGERIYSFSAVAEGVKTERIHYLGKLDILNEYEARRCVASGKGELEGGNYDLSAIQINSTITDCKGEGFHNTIWD